MKYQAYPEYKDLGIEWLGKVPQHWKINRFKNIFQIRKRIAGKLGFDILSITQKGIKIKDTESGDGQLSMDYSKYQLVYKDDFAMNHMDLLTGFVDISKYYGVTSPDYRVFSLEDKASNKRYCLYLLQLCYIAKIFYPLGQGAANIGRWRLPAEAFNEFVAPTPALDEQEKIANFLDHETAKIDTLIEKQQQLIKLLKEKRQAVISHAVTKGLNPNAPMRDSGVEWLGEVPEHWVVAQLKFNTIDMQTGPFGSQLHAEDYVDDGIPLVNPAHMTEGKILPDSKISVDEETWHRLKRHQLFEGDLIFARRGELGRCAIVTKEQEGWLCGTGSLKAKLNDRLVPEYSYLLITSDGVVSELSLESKGSTMDNLNTETLGRIRLPVPPVDEQKQVLAYGHLEKPVPMR
jgi:type I restriction enzyme S subunit